MYTAYPALDGEFCRHFSHASHAHVIDEQGVVVDIVQLPSSKDQCSEKHNWPDVLQRAQVDRLVVQLIGQRMLGRFIDAGFSVDQLPLKGNEFNPIHLDIVKRLSKTDGHRSPKFEQKQKQGGCKGAGHGHSQSHCCCH